MQTITIKSITPKKNYNHTKIEFQAIRLGLEVESSITVCVACEMLNHIAPSNQTPFAQMLRAIGESSTASVARIEGMVF